MSLYEDLGVPRDASDAEIKRAYRREAQKKHPDRPGGSAEAFFSVNHAYQVLSDRSRRARYDKTEDDAGLDVQHEAKQRVIYLLFCAIDAINDLEHINLIDSIRKRVRKDEASDVSTLAKLEEKVTRRQRVLRRIRRRVSDGRPNVLAAALEHDIEAIRRNIAVGHEALATHKAVFAVLDEYAYDADILIPSVFLSVLGGAHE